MLFMQADTLLLKEDGAGRIQLDAKCHDQHRNTGNQNADHSPENIKKTLELIRSLGVKPGIVVKPKTPAEAIAEYLPMVDLVLVMTVEPGFGGQKFMADMMPKLKQLRAMLDEVNPSCHLEVDGGVDLVTGEVCKENGADVLVAGSAYFKTADRAAFVKVIEA